uniref:Uncharacterized protein n=1 Tax=Ciona intestinalis TaxID=7719 RepID=H2Y3P2_CIOIN
MEAPVSKKGLVLTAGRYRLLQPIVISRGILQATDSSDNEGSLVSATKPLKPASPKQGNENIVTMFVSYSSIFIGNINLKILIRKGQLNVNPL